MILICPNCNSQFKVDIETFGSEKRKVRCSACLEVWEQKPHFDAVLGVIADKVREDIGRVSDVDSVSLGVDNNNRGSSYAKRIAAVRSWYSSDYEGREEKLLSRLIAGGMLLFSLIFLLVFNSVTMRAFPSAQAFYGIFGISMKIPDSDILAFEGVRASYKDGKVIVNGRIVNLSKDKWDIPAMEISVFTLPEYSHEEGHESEEVIGKWVKLPEQPELESEHEVEFSYEFDVDIKGPPSKIEQNGAVLNEHVEGHAEGGHNNLGSDGIIQIIDKQYYARIKFVLYSSDKNSNSDVVTETNRSEEEGDHNTVEDHDDANNIHHDQKGSEHAEVNEDSSHSVHH